ncbi:28S ribosomal protein S22, mitochondrial [Nilaparvata lugens]|uniref:28S ribosomal protein S22, mitochondrial n=1 Tax=Nilaparvata lugens TaxID=108931 RepID=UPI00193DBB62|nr:28S ribosomal protein S22, mitochondrial [Nilaparvata lugens]
MIKIPHYITLFKQIGTSTRLNQLSNSLNVRGLCDSRTGSIDHDIKRRFYEPEILALVKKLTRPDLQKVFRKRKLGLRLEPPEYKFMTTEQLEEERRKADARAEEKLQMPPVLPPRKEIDEVIAEDSNLAGFERSNIVFTDITFGKSDVKRMIVIREPNGRLRKANWDERFRINQVYFPKEGRKMNPPTLFKHENLMRLCEEQQYEFLLDLACAQFEPDDPEYLRITEAVYDKIDEAQAYESMRSTRHYGPFMFHLVTNRSIDDLLVENLQTDRLEDATWAISLYHLLHPESKSKSTKLVPGGELQFIKLGHVLLIRFNVAYV